MRSTVLRGFFVTLGVVCVVLGTIGAFVPLLPTTPFLIAAAFCFARGSSRMHRWLLSRPGVGPMLSTWEEQGAIPRRAKRLATVMMAISFSFPLFVVPDLALGVRVAAGLTMVSVLAYIWSRPDPR